MLLLLLAACTPSSEITTTTETQTASEPAPLNTVERCATNYMSNEQIVYAVLGDVRDVSIDGVHHDLCCFDGFNKGVFCGRIGSRWDE